MITVAGATVVLVVLIVGIVSLIEKWLTARNKRKMKRLEQNHEIASQVERDDGWQSDE